MREPMNCSLLGVKLWKLIPQLCNRRSCVYTLLLGDFSGNLPAMFFASWKWPIIGHYLQFFWVQNRQLTFRNCCSSRVAGTIRCRMSLLAYPAVLKKRSMMSDVWMMNCRSKKWLFWYFSFAIPNFAIILQLLVSWQ